MRVLGLVALCSSVSLSLVVAVWMGKYPPLSLPDRRRFWYGITAVLTGSFAAWMITVLYPA